MKTLGTLFTALMVAALLAPAATASAAEGELWNTYDGFDGPGKGKHVVLISGDEEYRSEEALSQLGKILAKHHGFKCTVLYAIDAKTGIINPNEQKNIPGTEALKTADLMIIATRFRNLPDEQMKPIEDFLKRGGAVIGMRTATHAFNMGGNYAHFSWRYNGEKKEWKQGFGKMVLGETWVAHHGGHKWESAHGIIAPDAKDHPIARGIKDYDVWGPSDVYTVRLPLPGDSKPVILGQVTSREGPRTDDIFFGMKPSDRQRPEPKKNKQGKVHDKNSPMMPLTWTKTYTHPETKKTGKVVTTTLGASTDLVVPGSRRMIVNSVYWVLGMDVPKGGTKVDTVGDYKPTVFGFFRKMTKDKQEVYWIEKGLRPKDFAMTEEEKK